MDAMKCAVLVALITLLPTVAGAATITLTSGGYSHISEGGALQVMQPGLFINVGHNNGIDASTVFGVASITDFLPFRGVDGTIILNGLRCDSASSPDEVDCGEITFTSAGLPPLPPPRSQPFIATVPFTASGYLNFDGVRHQIRGRGTLTGTYCFTDDCPIPTNDSPALRYSFSAAVPESPSKLLTLAFAVTVVGMVFTGRRRSAAGASGPLTRP